MNSITQGKEMIDKASMASFASYTTNSGLVIYGWLTVELLGVVFGILFGLATYITNWYYNRKRDKREKELHDLDVELKRRRKTDN